MISVIICTFNRDKYIYATLQKVAQNAYPTDDYEIVLINNNSTDTTEELCNKFKSEYQQVQFRYFVEYEQGLSFARNRGIKESKGDILAFLDDDAFVKPDYLVNIDNGFREYPEAMAFGGRIIPQFESGEIPKWLCKWTYTWLSALDRGDNVNVFCGKDFPIGANMGVRKHAIDMCGTFNVSLGRNKKNLLAGEEKDFFYRLGQSNLKTYYFPNVVVEHVIPQSRTSSDYVARMGEGVGMSEKIRCKSIGNKALAKRRLSEFAKWGATLLLWLWYCIEARPACGNMLVLFRWNVSKSLFANS